MRRTTTRPVVPVHGLFTALFGGGYNRISLSSLRFSRWPLRSEKFVKQLEDSGIIAPASSKTSYLPRRILRTRKNSPDNSSRQIT